MMIRLNMKLTIMKRMHSDYSIDTDSLALAPGPRPVEAEEVCRKTILNDVWRMEINMNERTNERSNVWWMPDIHWTEMITNPTKF